MPAPRRLPDPTLVEVDVRAAAAGDPTARAALLARYGPGIWALCTRLATTPEDAYQDVWAKLFAALPRFDPDGAASLKTWLHTVVHRRLIDLHRRRSARGQVIELPDLEAPGPTPEGEVALARRRRALDRALQALPDTQRRVVLLHHIAGHPIDAIATLEGIAPGTVKSRLHRARARLAELLEEQR